jgi:hypothetical protein
MLNLGLCKATTRLQKVKQGRAVQQLEGVKESMGELYGDRRVAEKWHGRLPRSAVVNLQGWRLRNAILFHPRTSVHGEEPYPTRGDPFMQNTADLKE